MMPLNTRQSSTWTPIVALGEKRLQAVYLFGHQPIIFSLLREPEPKGDRSADIRNLATMHNLHQRFVCMKLSNRSSL
jgi:hypothetical protein